MNKAILLDTETTGVDLLKNDIWQVAGYIIIDDKIVETFDIKFQPAANTVFNEEALKQTKMTKDHFANIAKTNDEGFEEFLKIISSYINKYDSTDKFQLIAYNAHFDANFLRKWFNSRKYCHYGSYFWSNNIDIMTFAAEFLSSIRHKMVNFKLQTVHRTLVSIGLLENKSYDGTHDALFDIEIEWDIYNLFRMNNIVDTLDRIKKLIGEK